VLSTPRLIRCIQNGTIQRQQVTRQFAMYGRYCYNYQKNKQRACTISKHCGTTNHANNPNQGSHTNMCQDKLSWDKWDTATLARRFQVWCMTMADIL